MSLYPARPDETQARCDALEPFTDLRGVIQPIVDAPIGGCALITSKAGSVRANHYHREDWHYCYVVSGKIQYFHREVASTASPTEEIYGPGEIFYSPPMIEHAMYFPEDTVFIVLSHMGRPHDAYEEDVIRVSDLTGRGGK